MAQSSGAPLETGRPPLHTAISCGKSGRKMSRSTIANVLVGYFVVAFALAVFLEWGEPTPYVDLAARSGVVIGHTLGWYALAGILPLLIWAVFRFRAEKARGPIGLWGIIGAVLIFLSCYGEMASRKERIAAAFPMTGLSAQARATPIVNATPKHSSVSPQ
jgi:hypothetical protein